MRETIATEVENGAELAQAPLRAPGEKRLPLPSSPWTATSEYAKASDEAHKHHRSGTLMFRSALEDVQWVTLADARQLDLPFVTHFVLDELKRVQPPAPEPPRCMRAVRGKMVVEAL